MKLQRGDRFIAATVDLVDEPERFLEVFEIVAISRDHVFLQRLSDHGIIALSFSYLEHRLRSRQFIHCPVDQTADIAEAAPLVPPDAPSS